MATIFPNIPFNNPQIHVQNTSFIETIQNSCSELFKNCMNYLYPPSEDSTTMDSPLQNQVTLQARFNNTLQIALKKLQSIAAMLNEVFKQLFTKEEDSDDECDANTNTTTNDSASKWASREFRFIENNIKSQYIEKVLSAISRTHCLEFFGLLITLGAGVVKTAYGAAQVVDGFRHMIYSLYSRDCFDVHFGISRVFHGIGNVGVGLLETNPLTIGVLLVVRTVVTKFYHSQNPDFYTAFGILTQEAEFLNNHVMKAIKFDDKLEFSMDDYLSRTSYPLMSYDTLGVGLINPDNRSHADSPMYHELMHFTKIFQDTLSCTWDNTTTSAITQNHFLLTVRSDDTSFQEDEKKNPQTLINPHASINPTPTLSSVYTSRTNHPYSMSSSSTSTNQGGGIPQKQFVIRQPGGTPSYNEEL